MQPDQLARLIGKWFQTHKDENPFAFGEVHLITQEEEAEILLIIGKPEEEYPDFDSYANQWEGTIYDAPVTWLWQKLLQDEADEWLRIIYPQESSAMKKQMLEALLELFQLIESNGFTMDWEPVEDDEWRTRLYLNSVAEKTAFETNRWRALLAKHLTS